MNNKLALVFPGQGSQSVGMLAELAEVHPEIKQTFSEASEALGYDLWKIASEGPVEELNQTHVTQPAMLSAGVAIWRVWQQAQGGTPGILAGHSLGEYTALTCAGALQFTDAVNLVETRGKYMQQAVPQGKGAMAAILGLADENVIQVCDQASEGETVSAVNFNAPGQVVIAGEKTAVERATLLAKEAGAKRAIVLPVSVPSHCSLMMPAAEKLREKLAGINIVEPRIKVLNNADVQVKDDAEGIRAALVKQLHQPVRWVETIQKMSEDGIENIVECGPGKVLMGLNKRIDKQLNHFSVFDSASLQQALSAVNQ